MEGITVPDSVPEPAGGEAAAGGEALIGGETVAAGETLVVGEALAPVAAETLAGGEVPAGTETLPGDHVPAGGVALGPIAAETPAGSQVLAGGEVPAGSTVPQPSARRRGLFVTGWLASALAVGAGAGFGILAVVGTSKDSVAAASVPVAPPTTPSPSVTSGVRPDGTHYGNVKDFLLPVPGGFEPGPDAGGLGNDASIPPSQADPIVALLFGELPSSDLTTAQGAIATGGVSDGAVRTFASQGGDLDVDLTVLRLNPAQSAESTGQFERVVKQSRAFRNGPQVRDHPEALCVLPVTHVGDPLDSMTCLATVGDTLAIVNAEGTVPLDTNAVTDLFGRQLDTLKNGLGT